MGKLDRRDVTSYGVRILGVVAIPPGSHSSDWQVGYAVGREYEELYEVISEVEGGDPVLEYVRECAVGLMDTAWQGKGQCQNHTRGFCKELFLKYKLNQDQEMTLLLEH
jgi:hypothetical protein